MAQMDIPDGPIQIYLWCKHIGIDMKDREKGQCFPCDHWPPAAACILCMCELQSRFNVRSTSSILLGHGVQDCLPSTQGLMKGCHISYTLYISVHVYIFTYMSGVHIIYIYIYICFFLYAHSVRRFSHVFVCVCFVLLVICLDPAQHGLQLWQHI